MRTLADEGFPASYIFDLPSYPAYYLTYDIFIGDHRENKLETAGALSPIYLLPV